MAFSLVDVILIVIFFGFVFAGYAMGLIRSIGAIVGISLGTWVAGHYFMPVADFLAPLIGGREALAKIIGFLLIFAIVNQLVVLVFHLLDHAYHLISIIPFLKSLNRLGGVILGAIGGLLTLGVAIYIIAKFMPDASFVTDSLDSSKVAHTLVFSAQWLIKLLPSAFSNIVSIF